MVYSVYYVFWDRFVELYCIVVKVNDGAYLSGVAADRPADRERTAPDVLSPGAQKTAAGRRTNEQREMGGMQCMVGRLR